MYVSYISPGFQARKVELPPSSPQHMGLALAKLPCLGPSCLAHLGPEPYDQMPGASGLSHGLRHPLEENPVLPLHNSASQIMTAPGGL